MLHGVRRGKKVVLSCLGLLGRVFKIHDIFGMVLLDFDVDK